MNRGVRAQLRSMGSVSAVTLATLAAYLLAVLLLGRNLPRDRFGYLTLWVYGLNLLGAASLLGFPNALLRHFPRERLHESRWPSLYPSMAALNATVCAGGALVFRALYGASWWDTGALFVASASVGLSLLPVTMLQIFRRFAIAQAIYTLWRPVLLAVTLLLLVRGDLAERPLLAAVAAAGMVQLGLSLVAMRREPRGAIPMRLRAMAPDAAVFSGLYVAAMLILRLDSFFLPKLMNLDALGLYSALSFLMLTGYGVVSLALGQVLSPKLASREPVPLGAVTALLMVGGIGVGLALAAASNTLLPLLFGDRYAGDHRVAAAVLALAGLLQVLYAVPSSRIGVLASTRALRLYLPLSLTSLAVDAVLLWLLVPRWGITGAAAASAFTWLWRTAGAWGVAWIAVRDESVDPSAADGAAGR
jgi:O-antigen/teichoic acid export membrane protein